MPHPPVVLVVAGWDPSGAAGLAQDLKVLAAVGAHACGAPAALTVQGQGGVAQVQGVDPELLRQQLQTLLKEQPVAAVKLGLLYSAAQANVVADVIEAHPGLPLVIDPVLGASAGGTLTLPDLILVLKSRLFPLCTVLTPNLDESAVLTGLPKIEQRSDMPKHAYKLLEMGAKAVLLKGGHLDGMTSADFYLDANQEAWLEGPRIETQNSRGTGCALASAIAAQLASGQGSAVACRAAKVFLTKALQNSKNDDWGPGAGPIQFG